MCHVFSKSHHKYYYALIWIFPSKFFVKNCQKPQISPSGRKIGRDCSGYVLL
ncbi:Uncharacterized protein dnm_037200 [Desulfonema magnum]|uniref:Uncharacterized protein n=1 Tax=Desulfonema magnum TaxID=45655 RepID=A0A975GN79_9BACT|nr:Uncharacterized protein dnm_037200 [Desulfonema magnum]